MSQVNRIIDGFIAAFTFALGFAVALAIPFGVFIIFNHQEWVALLVNLIGVLGLFFVTRGKSKAASYGIACGFSALLVSVLPRLFA